MVSRDVEQAHEVWKTQRKRRLRRVTWVVLFFNLLLGVMVFWEDLRAPL